MKSKVPAGIRADKVDYIQLFYGLREKGRANKKFLWIKYEMIVVAGIDLIKANFFSLVFHNLFIKKSFGVSFITVIQPSPDIGSGSWQLPHEK